MQSVIEQLATANDTTVTKFLDTTVTKFLDQATNDITVTKFLDIEYPMRKQLEQVEDDIAITKYLVSTNDTSVTKFL